MIGLGLATAINNRYDGNLSVLYPYIQDGIEAMNYCVEDGAFLSEFPCFEADYAAYRLHMQENGLVPETIYDIGCQFGFQSVLFADSMQYVGIDMVGYGYFNTENPNVSYITGVFPKGIKKDFSGETVISNMSMGYFNARAGICDQDIVDALSDCKTLYIGTTPELIKALKPKYANFTEFRRHYHEGFPRVAMWN